jgi:hypothetical protein
MNLEPAVPLILVVKYDNYQDVAAGLSFALALEKLRGHEISNQLNTDSLAFVYKSSDLSTLSNKIPQVSTSHISQLNLWFVGSSMRKQDFAPQLALTHQIICNLDTNHHHRIGSYPYQFYRCDNRK